MAEGTSFQIDLAVSGAASATSAAEAAALLADKLLAAGKASTEASDAVKASEVAYREAEATADRAAKALERITIQADAQKGKLAAALDAGDAKGIERAQAKLEQLNQRQQEAQAKASSTAGALSEQASTLDKLKTAAMEAAEQESKLASESHALEAASKSAADAAGKQAKALADVGKGSGNINEMAEGLGKIGGPVGVLGQKALGGVQGIKKLTASMGSSTGMMAAGALGAAAFAAAVIAIGVAAVNATAEILKWSFALNPKNTERLNAQTKTLQGNLGKLFGLNFDKLLDGFDRLVALFDESSVTGKAMKVVFESIFQPIVDGLVDLIPKVESAFIQFEILALKALIAIKPFGSTIVMIAEGVGILALAIVGVLVIAFGLVLAAVAATAAAIMFFGSVLTDVINFVKTLDLKAVGTALIMGFADGITGGAASVVKAIVGVSDGAIDAAKKALGIKSPSTVFAAIGVNTGEGMVQGVDASAGEVKSSLETMTAPPEASGAGASKGGAGAGLNMQGAVFNFYGVEGAEDAEGRFGGLLTRLLEGDVASLGAAVPNG